MKRFKIYSVLLWVVFMLAVFFSYGVSLMRGGGLTAGLNSCFGEVLPHLRTSLYMDVVPQVSCHANGVNELTGDSILILPNNVSIVEGVADINSYSAGYKCATITLRVLNTAVIVLYVLIFVLFIKIMHIVVRRELFADKVVTMLRRMGCYFIALWGVTTAWKVGRTAVAASIVKIESMRFSYLQGVDWHTLIIGLFLLVFAEILLHAVQIKRENDLTI